jgi:hypothetical protein
MTTTAPLFDDLPVPPPRRKAFVPRYCPRNPALQTALRFAMAAATAPDEARRKECHEKMMLAIRAKDGLA